MEHSSLFKASQIVCLDTSNHRLYGEVIQVIIERELCWVRPLILATITEASSPLSQEITPHNCLDLRYTSDLFYPLSYFRPALDTEVIHLLDYLIKSDIDTHQIPDHRSKLNAFLQKIRPLA